jgi:hypothetical protein
MLSPSSFKFLFPHVLRFLITTSSLVDSRITSLLVTAKQKQKKADLHVQGPSDTVIRFRVLTLSDNCVYSFQNCVRRQYIIGSPCSHRHIWVFVFIYACCWAGLCSRNALDLYSGGTRFKTRPAHRAFRFEESREFLRLRESNVIRLARIGNYQLFSSSFIHNSTIRHHVCGGPQRGPQAPQGATPSF